MPPALPNGLYKLAFETASGAEYGVAYLQDGKLRGGDSGMAYVGTYELDGNMLTADFSVTQHRHVPGAVSALGFNNVQVQLCGVVDEANVVRLTGTSTMSKSIKFGARLSMLAD